MQHHNKRLILKKLENNLYKMKICKWNIYFLNLHPIIIYYFVEKVFATRERVALVSSVSAKPFYFCCLGFLVRTPLKE